MASYSHKKKPKGDKTLHDLYLKRRLLQRHSVVFNAVLWWHRDFNESVYFLKKLCTPLLISWTESDNILFTSRTKLLMLQFSKRFLKLTLPNSIEI